MLKLVSKCVSLTDARARVGLGAADPRHAVSVTELVPLMNRQTHTHTQGGLSSFVIVEHSKKSLFPSYTPHTMVSRATLESNQNFICIYYGSSF